MIRNKDFQVYTHIWPKEAMVAVSLIGVFSFWVTSPCLLLNLQTTECIGLGDFNRLKVIELPEL